jgi:hypothetical protein
MANMKVVSLAEPVEWFDKRVSSVTVREPKASHLMRFGEPQITVFAQGGAAQVFRDDAVSSYLDALLSLNGSDPVDGGGSAFFSKLSLQDGIAVRDALHDFFIEARLANVSKKPTGLSLT